VRTFFIGRLSADLAFGIFGHDLRERTLKDFDYIFLDVQVIPDVVKSATDCVVFIVWWDFACRIELTPRSNASPDKLRQVGDNCSFDVPDVFDVDDWTYADRFKISAALKACIILANVCYEVFITHFNFTPVVGRSMRRGFEYNSE
jgi:hypothetical protein